MRHVLVTFFPLVLLWTLIAQANYTLSSWHIYLFLGGLYVTYAALMLPRRAGLAVTLLGGLLCDAGAPVAFGTHLVLFAVAFAVLAHLRDRLPREDTVARIIITLLVNLGLFLIFSFTQIGGSPMPTAAWPRLIADLVYSQICLALIAPWFFALQHRALLLARAERESID